MAQSKRAAFQPTKAMVQAADCLLVATARRQLIEEKVRGYQRAILADMQAPASPELQKAATNHPDQAWLLEPVLEPKNSFLLRDEDFAIYAERCTKAAAAAGLEVPAPGYCPLSLAETLEFDAKVLLVDAMKPLTGLDSDTLRQHLGLMKQYVSLSLNLLAPFVDPHKRFGIPAPGGGQ